MKASIHLSTTNPTPSIPSCLTSLLISPHPRSFIPLLRLPAARKLPNLGLGLHGLTVVLGLSSNPHVASSLLTFYSKTNSITIARKVFDTMTVRNIVPWSAIIAGYSNSGDQIMAFSMYRQMLEDGIRPNSVTLLGLLSGSTKLESLECVHASAVRYGFDVDTVFANSMVNVYGKFGCLDSARALFDSMTSKDLVSWNSMIVGYSRIGEGRESFELFKEMRVKGECPNHQTYGCLLSSITSHRLGKSVHALVITSGFQSDTQIETGLISFYLKFASCDDAFRIFDRSSDRDVVAWTAMISGLIQSDSADTALFVFNLMLSLGVMPTTTTIASILSACAQLSLFFVGASIHGFIIRRELLLDSPAKNSLMTMYAKCGHLRQCELIFEEMGNPDLVSWNAIISGYGQSGCLELAFVHFRKMRSKLQRPDTITIVSLLQACASLGSLTHGKLIHNFVIRHELPPCISIDTSVLDMYAKCGDLKRSRRCFDLIPEKDLISWSAIISGYGSNGMGSVALVLYSEFLKTGFSPNDVMFMSVLSACAHSGLVSQGLQIFKSMQKEFNIVPKLEHYACVVDLLSRAGKIEEAVEFVVTMPIKPNADVLGILLDACCANGYDKLAEMVVKEIVALKPESAGSFVQLAHGYAAMRQWDFVGEVWTKMRGLGLRKTPGWSFIDLNGEITTFFASSGSDSKYEEMNFMLKVLRSEMREI